MAFAPDDTLYYQTKTPINFWCRHGLNLKSLIQLLKSNLKLKEIILNFRTN